MLYSSGLQEFTKSLSSILFVILLFGVTDVVADEELIGASEYSVSCLSCHGVEGKGDGPLAELLTVKPSDLTVIAKNNEGIFPLHQVFRVIDGRHGVTGHGERDMPVWGARYMREYAQGCGLIGAEDVVRSRILELVYYIQSIQQK